MFNSTIYRFRTRTLCPAAYGINLQLKNLLQRLVRKRKIKAAVLHELLYFSLHHTNEAVIETRSPALHTCKFSPLRINASPFPPSCPVLHLSTCYVRVSRQCRPFTRWKSWPLTTLEMKPCWRAPTWPITQAPVLWRSTPSSGAGCTFVLATLVSRL